MIIFGLIVTYIMVNSFIKITTSFEEMSKQLASETVKAKRNEITMNSLPGLVIVTVGVLLIRIGFKREEL
jgi:hypothetical protein